jgi:hypothetical protein
MDTRFWGPDGWKLLHSIPHNYPETPTKDDKNTYAIFFESIKYILPCIYCRMSYTEYINDIPINNYLDSRKKLAKWVYLIHNKVNDKLRKQGLLHYDDPTFDSVYKKYEEYIYDINKGEKCIEIPGWNFIYCIVFNYPLNENHIETIRKNNYEIFFRYLGYVIPFPNIKKAYQTYITKHPIYKFMKNRQELKQWSYDLESYISENTHIPCMSYNKRCKLIEDHRAGCKRKTCRHTKKN